MRTFFIAFALWAGIDILVGDVSWVIVEILQVFLSTAIVDASRESIYNTISPILVFLCSFVVLSQIKTSGRYAVLFICIEIVFQYLTRYQSDTSFDVILSRQQEFQNLISYIDWDYPYILAIVLSGMLTTNDEHLIKKILSTLEIQVYPKVINFIPSSIKLRQWFCCLSLIGAGTYIANGFVSIIYFKMYQNYNYSVSIDESVIFFVTIVPYLTFGVVTELISLYVGYQFRLKTLFAIAFIMTLIFSTLPALILLAGIGNLYELLNSASAFDYYFNLIRTNISWLSLVVGIWLARKIFTQMPEKEAI